MALGKYVAEARTAGLLWVVAGFSTLAFLNLVTLALGPEQVLRSLNVNWLGIVPSVFVFDSWGTFGGLLSVVALFTPMLFGEKPSLRRSLSAFFLAGSVLLGVFASAVWTVYYNSAGFFGSGSSSIAFAAQGIVFGLSLFGLLRLAGLGSMDRRPRPADSWFFAGVYVVIMVSTLYFILFLQPIFTPTDLYNWRVHEIGFVLSVVATGVYEVFASLQPSVAPPPPQRKGNLELSPIARESGSSSS